MHNVFSSLNNREIAIGIWGIIVIIALCFWKPGRVFYKNILSIMFSKKFVVFYLIMGTYLLGVVFILYKLQFWNISFFKDTIIWFFFIQFPIFAKSIDKAKDERFFIKIIKNNIKFIIIIEFILNYFVFDLWVEIIGLPVLFFIGACIAVAQHQREKIVVDFLNKIVIIVNVSIVIYTIINIFISPFEILSVASLKTIILPVLLLLFNLPVVYGLALYSTYEQIFIWLKGNKSEQKKMRKTIILFGKFNLKKVYKLRINNKVLTVSLNNSDLKKILKELKDFMELEVGENYMKKANGYLILSIIILLLSIFLFGFCNVDFDTNDLMKSKFLLTDNDFNLY